MTDIAPVSSTIDISVLKMSEDLAMSQAAALLPPQNASPVPAPVPPPAASDSASFSAAALAQLAQTQSGMALLH